MILLYSVLIITFTAAGQILLKKGAVAKDRRVMFKLVFLGYILFGMSVLLSYMLLKYIPMKYYTVIMSMNYIAVLFAAKIFLREKIDRTKAAGTFLIALGILIFFL